MCKRIEKCSETLDAMKVNKKDETVEVEIAYMPN